MSISNCGVLFGGRVGVKITMSLGSNGLVMPIVRSTSHLGLGKLTLDVGSLTLGTHGGGLAPSRVDNKAFAVAGCNAFGVLFNAPMVGRPRITVLNIKDVRGGPIMGRAPRKSIVTVQRGVCLSLSCSRQMMSNSLKNGFLRFVTSCLRHFASRWYPYNASRRLFKSTIVARLYRQS